MLEEKRVIQIVDAMDTDAYRSGDPDRRAIVDLAGARTLLLVPLLKDDAVRGIVTIYRQEVRPFSNKEIALVQNFAAQAVIAIENARLITETREALERQTATAEILRVISSSPTDVKPTFDAIAAAAKTLSDAALSAVLIYDGKLIHWAAAFGWTPDELDKIRGVFPIPPDRGTTVGRAILTRHVAHIEDMSTDPEYAYPALAQSGGHTVLAVPMLRDGVPIGAINVQRRRVELFSDKQIDLLKTFADQAVIAIENVRLFNELRDRQAELARSVDELTATGDVLKIISRSSVDLETVLDTLVETVRRLCRADQTYMFRLREEMWRLVASSGLSEEAKEHFHTHPFTPGRGSTPGRAVLERRPVLIPDVLVDPEYTLIEGQRAIAPRSAFHCCARKR